MNPTLVRKEDTLVLDLAPVSGSHFHDCLTKVKDIPGSKFDWDDKLWLLPAEVSVAERLVASIRPDVDQEVSDWMRDERSQESQQLTTPLPQDAELQVPWATQRMEWQPEFVNDEEFDGLFGYQRSAVDHMVNARRVILADQMGVGKTIQAISAVEEYKLRNSNPDGPKLVICPNSVKGSWARELDRWLEQPNYQIVDATSFKARTNQIDAAIDENAWVICNWEQIRIKKEQKKLKNGGRRTVTSMKEPLFEKTDWLAVVADEVHRAKNRKAKQTQGLWRIEGDLMLGLSGTPLMNSPDELWAILKWLFPKEYTSYWRFYEQYVDYYENYFQKIITGVKNPDALRFELKNRLVRRTSAEARGKDTLPGCRRIYEPIKLNKTQRALYDEANTKFWLEVKQEAEAGDEAAKKLLTAADDPAMLYKIANGASRTVRLRQIIETPATLGGEDDSAILDFFEEKYVDSRPEPWLVFCEFKATCDTLKQRMEDKHDARVAIYNGDVDQKDRAKIEDAFQRGEIDVLVGTTAALQEGITLTRGHLQYWCSRNWVPDKNEQGEARQADRIGQAHMTMIYVPMPENTIAVSKVQPTNTRKEAIVRTVLAKDPIQEEHR